MSWLSVFLRGGGKKAVLADLFDALMDGKITQSELQTILVKVGLGVVNAGAHKEIQQAYELTDPEKLRKLADKGLDLALAQVQKAHIIIGLALEEVK